MGKNSMKHLAKLERFLLKSANYCALNIYLLGSPLFLYQKLKKTFEFFERYSCTIIVKHNEQVGEIFNSAFRINVAENAWGLNQRVSIVITGDI
jgi:hypothetical protein